VTISYALSVETHVTINQYIAGNTINSFSLNNYLKKNLGFSEGKDEFINGQEVYRWLGDGGIYEDVPPWTIIPYLRSVNHFHNPLNPWNAAGLNDIFTGTSSVIWAQDQSSAGILLGGDWSWKKAREYFYIALTGKDFSGNILAMDKVTRDKAFADTFRAVGQVMHLVQDASVPAHVRNDSHILIETYEEWVEDTRANNQSLFNSLIATPLSFDSAILNETPNPLAPIPIAKIFDTDKYNYGTNPSISFTWGISEYANSNFASDDTIFTEYFDPNHKHYFPFPRYSPESYEIYEIDIQPDKKRLYLRKRGDGEVIEHFATVGPLYKYLSFAPVLQRDELELDGECNKDYAEKLLPRSVGYSAGLLNYFFRGKLEAVNPDILKDGRSNILGTKFRVKNLTTDEAIGLGKLIVSYQYKPAGSNDFVYGTSKEVFLDETISFNSESISQFAFTFHPSIPSDAQETKFLLVFRGKLGNEDDAVVPVELKEKQPISILIASCIFDYEGDNLHYGILNIANNTVTENIYPLKVRGDNDYYSLISAPDDNSGEAFVVDETTLFKINIETGEVLSSVSNTWGAYVSGIISKGNFIYLSIIHYPNTMLYKLNRADLSEIGSVELTSSAWSWWLTSFIITNDNYIYVSLPDKIYKLDLNLSVLNSIEKPHVFQTGLAYYGGYIYTTYWDGLHKYDTNLNFVAKISNPPSDYFGESLKIDKDGEYLYIGDFQPTVKKIRLSDFSYVGVIDLTDYLFYQVWTMAYDKVKNLIIAGDGYYGLVTINLDTFTLENHVSTFKGSNNSNAWNSIDVAYK
jgi:hypothetical protein